MIWEATIKRFSVVIPVEEALWFGAVFLEKEKTDLFFIDATISKQKYMRVLEKLLLPSADCAYGTGKRGFLFIKDNAAVHIARDYTRFFIRLKMNFLPWPRAIALSQPNRKYFEVACAACVLEWKEV